MQSFRRALSVFAVGGMLYCASELLYRRRTHPSMFAAGGLALLTADRVRRVRCRGGAVVRVSLCTGAFTFIELCIGLLVNRRGRTRVWDYSRMPLNYKGQICLPFTLLWAALSAPRWASARFCDVRGRSGPKKGSAAFETA